MEQLKQYIRTAKYYETDQMKIVHHSNYIRWFEEARVDVLEQAGLPYDQMEADGIISAVLEVHTKYHKMVRFPEEVRIDAFVTKYNGVVLEVNYTVTGTKEGDLRCSGSTRHCFLDKDYHPVSLKKKFPEYDQKFRELAAISKEMLNHHKMQDN